MEIYNLEATNVVVRNNVVSNNLSFQVTVVSTGSGLMIDHNLIDGFRGDTGETRGTDAVEGDPLYVNPGSGDFHLRAVSSAIDHGSPEGVPDIDLDGHVRPVGAAPDLGAFEYGSAPAGDAGTRDAAVADPDAAVAPRASQDEERTDGCSCGTQDVSPPDAGAWWLLVAVMLAARRAAGPRTPSC